MKLRLNMIFICGLVLTAGYLLYAPFTRHVLTQRQHAIDKVNITELNYLIPPFADMVNFTQKSAHLEAHIWVRYINYFKKITEVMPGRFEAYALLGYSYYQHGDKALAQQYYEKAVTIDPQFFWGDYGLGLLAAQQGDCQKSAVAFNLALKVPVRTTVETMLSSKLYLDILRETPSFEQTVGQGLDAAYKNAYTLGAMAVQCVQGSKQAGEQLRQLALGTQIQVF